MSLDIVLTLTVLLLATAALVWEVLPADAVLLTALAIVTAAGVVELETALQGFANPTLLALGSLYVIAESLRRTGALERASHHLIGEASKGLKRVLARLSAAVALSSAFLNNTPVVAMAIPAVRGWARRHAVSTARLLMPVSFASILGGLCTLVGTSTNLVTDGLMRSHGLAGLGFFELARVGVPCALLGIAYLVFVSPALLEAREDVRDAEERERESMLELEVLDESPLIGKTADEAGMTRTPGMTLARIARRGFEARLEADSHSEPLQAGDRLVFAGEEGKSPEIDPDDLENLRAAAAPGSVEGEETHEAVIKEGSKLVGETVDEADFPSNFNARVTGVRRGGKRFAEPTGEVRLRPGDIIMLDTGIGFREAFETSPDLFVVSQDEEPPGEEASGEPTISSRLSMAASVLVLLAVVSLAATGVLHIAMAGLLGAVTLVALRLISAGEAREAIDWSVLIVIGAALGLASALEASGGAELLAHGIVGSAAGFGPIGILAGLVVATMVLTGLITNNAAAALVFPIALSVAESQGLDPRPLLIGITIAASLSLWTPLGYQTNLMVYGPGNYRFTDFTRVGLPMQLLLAAVAIAVIPLAWSF